MKISIGIYGYKTYENLEKREKFCIQSLKKLKKNKLNIDVNLYNLNFKDQDINYDDFVTLKQLTKKSCDVIKNYFAYEGLQKEYQARKKEIDENTFVLPTIKEMFDVLSKTDCDYICLLNNDIIVSDRVLKELEENVECYPISRMHIYDIETLEDIPKLESYSVHGFDAFIVKKDTWLQIRNNFEDLVIGRFYWDTYFFTLFNLFCKCKNLNKLPPVCFHIEHSSKSGSENYIENYFNEDVFKRNLLVGRLWFSYVQNILLKRQTVNDCKWYLPFINELDLEQKYFNTFPQTSFTIQENIKPTTLSTEQKYDIVIPAIEKDFIKLPFLLESIFANLDFNKIYIVTPQKNNFITDSKIVYLQDNEVLPNINKNEISYRPGWTYQQLIKLFQNVTDCDYYLTIDSDVVFLKPVHFFENNKPIWYFGWPQNNLPYFLFMEKILKLPKTLSHTGIGDIGLFNKKITKSLLEYCTCETPYDFFNGIKNKMSLFFHLSEYEVYSNFCAKYFSETYLFKKIKQITFGKDSNIGQIWLEKEILTTINSAKQTDKEILLMHTWN